MKRIVLILTLLAIVASGVSAEIPFATKASADQPLAKCKVKEKEKMDGDKIGLIICEKGKELPKDVVDKVPDNMKHRLKDLAFGPAPKPQDESNSLLFPGCSNCYVGADFDCGLGVACGSEGHLGGWTAIYVTWYRYNWIEAGSGYEACEADGVCFYITYYDPISTREAQRVDVWGEFWHSSEECACTNFEWCFAWEGEP